MKRNEGHPHSLADLCEEFYPKILKYMYYRVGPNIAEDLTEDVFVKVLKGISQQKDSFSGWIYRIAANVINDNARARKRSKESPMTDHSLREAPESEDWREKTRWKLDLEDALQYLSEDQGEFIILKYIIGLSNAEIGEISGRKPEAIRGLQFRALAALRKVFADRI